MGSLLRTMPAPHQEAVWSADLYARASREDGGASAQSETITNQVALLEEYVASHTQIRLHRVCIDDGISGVVFDRPGFQQVLEDVRSGAANCLIVKDLSRLGRNYYEAGRYIDDIFPFLGVRFIAVNDSIDSLNGYTPLDHLMIPVKNIFNDQYAYDISLKVRSSQNIKRANGAFVGSYAPYGYQKDPENRNQLRVDAPAAAVVQDIFLWKLDGMSPAHIADRLNQMGVPSPMEYKQHNGIFSTPFKTHETAHWAPKAVFRILQNEQYLGTMVQGKSTTPNYKIKKSIPIPPDQWLRVENTHEPIIERAIFELANDTLACDTRAAPGSGVVYPFSGLLICADCGQSMVRKTIPSSGKHYVYYECGTHKNKQGCSSHRIRADRLGDAVLAAVQVHMTQTLHRTALLNWINDLPRRRTGGQLNARRAEALRYHSLLDSLPVLCEDGTIHPEDYDDYKAAFTQRLIVAEQAAAHLQREMDAATAHGQQPESNVLSELQKLGTITNLSRRAAVFLIARVLVFRGSRVEIKFRYRDPWEAAMPHNTPSAPQPGKRTRPEEVV